MEVEVAALIPRLEFELEVNSIPKLGNGIGIGIDGIVPMTDWYQKKIDGFEQVTFIMTQAQGFSKIIGLHPIQRRFC